jgi:uncharacterized protein (TIGR02147 family)
MTPSQDFKQLLAQKYEERCERNSRYSMRAFARDLGLSASGLSQILSGRQGLSRASADKIGKRLGLTAQEISYYCDLVESQHGRGEKSRRLAEVRLRKYDTSATTLQLDAFKVISDWYHFAILELTTLEGFQSSHSWMAKALGIQVKVLDAAVARLMKLDLLEKVDGRYRQTVTVMATPSGIPSDALKKFHRQLIEKALQALIAQTVDERDITSTVLSIRSADLPRAKTLLKELRRTFVAKMEDVPEKNRLYCLSIQFFNLLERESSL